MRTAEGFLHLAAEMNLHSRRIVGWQMASHLRTELVADALEMAIARRRPGPGLVHHSDQGAAQFTSLAFGQRLREAGIVPSMGAVGTAYDNAVAESFFGSFKRELVHRRRFAARSQARSEIFEWIEVFYSRHAATPRSVTCRLPSSKGTTLVPSSRGGNVSVKAGQAQLRKRPESPP